MIIDCDSCVMKHLACEDCVVSFLTDPARDSPDIGVAEHAALAVLADSGLVPPLRLRRTGAG